MARVPRHDGPEGSRLGTGDRIGPYVILEMLGSGGMGEVFRAHDERLKRDVAIKRLSDSAIEDADARRRVLREARAAAALSHPGIAAVFDVLETPDGLAIVMEFVPGESLADRLARGPLAPAEAIQIALQIADALADAHDRGVIHQDLKPANVHLTPGGKAKILDFGIARTAPAIKEDANRFPDTAAGQIIGTPGYMAPEQMSGGRVDARTDIYGAGLLLFEMLTGRRAFDQPDLFARARAILRGAVPRIEDIDASLPRALGGLVARAMAVNPDDRFANARELHGALGHAARQLSDVPTMDDTDRARVRSSSGWAGTRRRLRQHRLALTAAAVLVAIAALVIWQAGRDTWSSPVAAYGATVGVLPLRSDSGDVGDAALALGLTEGIAARLSTLPSLRVLALDDSREAADGADPARAARTLGAAFVLDGALRRDGETLAVDVSLVRHDGHRTPAGRYRGNASGLFDLHRRIAEGVTDVLNAEGLSASGASLDTAPPTTNQEAYADYMQARLFLERPDVPGNLDHAIRLFGSAIARDPQFAQAHAGLGQAFWALYQETRSPEWTGRATAAILDALRLDPDRPEVRMSLAVMYRGLGRIEDAQTELRKVLAAQPANDDAHRLLGAMHTDRGEWDQAIEEIERAITIRPNYWRNHSELGFALFRAGRLDAAEAAYQRVTQLQPDSARGYHMLGTVQQSAGDTAAALESYRRANELRPAYSTWSNMGTILFWQGDYEGAAGAYEQAIALAPNEPDLYANLGDAQRKLGRHDAANASYRQAVERMRRLLAVNEQDAVNLAVLGMYHAKLEERDEASAALQRALALNPDDGDVLLNGAIVHTLAGDTAGACTMLDRALTHGASPEIVRRTDELQALTGCAAWDRVAERRR